MVSCPFTGREGSKCSVTARRWTRVTLLALGRRPSLGWRSWRCYSPLIMTLDDIGGLAGPISCPLFLGSSIPQTVVGIWGGLFTFARMHILGWVWLDIFYIYICLSLFFPLFFFFYDAWDSVLHWWLTGSVAHVVATCLTSISWEASFPVETFSVSRIFQGQKRPLDINLSFLALSPSCYSLTFLLRVVSPTSCVAHFALCLLSFLLILRYVPYLNFISFLIFCLLNPLFSLFLCIFFW